MKKFFISIAVVAGSLSATATAPLWLRDVKISPDGKQIAFTYKGDIYKVSAAGGDAVRLTTQPSYESLPIWSPDGKKIAFSTDRNGGSDIYVMSADGGQAKRLTYNSAAEVPEAFSTDGKEIYFSACLQDPVASAMFPSSRLTELYKIQVAGGQPQQVMGTPAQMISFSSDGTAIVYQDQKGMEDEWRKHHTSSVTRDIWKYDFATGKHTNLTNRGGEDRNPVFSPDNNTIYFLSERNGKSFNVFSFPADNPSAVSEVTSFKTHPVRFLSSSNSGVLAFAYNGEIYTKHGSASPQKVNINITLDDENLLENIAVSNGASGAVASPDGKQVAFTKRGEVFVTSVEYTTTKQITNTAAAERQITWAPDNRTIAYTSERDGHWNIYQAEIARSEDINFPNATIINEKPLFDPKDGIDRTYPSFSPDGNELAFIQDRNKLMVMNLKSRKIKQITDGSTYARRNGGFDYSWSPDGKWFVLSVVDNKHDPYCDVAIVSADGGKITNITQSGYFDEMPRWALDGNAIVFLSERYGMRNHASWGSELDVMMVFLNQDAYDKYSLNEEDYALYKEVEKEQKKKNDKTDNNDTEKKEGDEKAKVADTKSITVELEGIQDRMVRITPYSSDICDAIVTKDGKSLYYLSAAGKGYDLWKIDLRKKDIKQASKLNAEAMTLQMDSEGKNIFLLGGKTLKKMDAKSEKMSNITFSSRMQLDLAAEREYMFNYVYRQEKEMFYVKSMHGVNWDKMTDNYRRFLPHINNNYDFAELLSEWLGELNVSHTGGRYYGPSPKENTASLGLLFDLKHNGNGLKVAEVLEKGPFDRANSKVKRGCIIEKINGTEISEKQDYASLLNGIAKKKTLVSVFNPATGERFDEVILPISSAVNNQLLYERWVKQRAADVERWSNGRLGYVHIKSMGDDSFRKVYSDILGKYNHCEGIVIDTRWNGGGRLHEDIEVLFSGNKYFTQVIRGTEACDMPSRRWNKPSIMVQCEANYSNAHGTPWVYKHRGLGKLVGAPVPGTMTSVNWVTLQDPSLVFGIPVVGYELPDGTYLENSQLEPDIYVLNTPEDIVIGEDTQLRTAVESLLNDLSSK